MPINKKALIRFQTIDKCLQNSFKKWTLNDLIEACSDALYDLEGKDVTISKRTIQSDIQLMRSDKLGYNAPIEVYEKKYYRYEDPDYSISKVPLTKNDLNVLSETVSMLNQFKGFSLFSDLQDVIKRLEEKVNTEILHQSPIIHFDRNEHLKGFHFLDTLYQAIQKKLVLSLSYQSFKAREISNINLSPYLLKEYNNRWFILGIIGDKVDNIQTLALDRIVDIEYNTKVDYQVIDFDSDEFYKDTIGVTVLKNQPPETIVFQIGRENAPYVITKPFHKSQELLGTHEDGSSIFRMKVHHNLELERLLLGFGKHIKIISPTSLKRKLRSHYRKALRNYQD